jgi:hypothetical protein
VLATIDAAGPFAAALPIAQQTGNTVFEDRALYQAIGRLSIRVGQVSAVDGLFGAAFAGASYIHVQLNADNLSGNGTVVSPIVGIGFGYTRRIMTSLLMTAELDVVDAPDVQVLDRDKNVGVLTETGHYWMALNVSAALPLF